MTRHRIATVLAASLLLSLASPAARALDGPIAISSSSIDFGQVAVGTTGSASVTLTNTGASPFGPINMFGGAPPTEEYDASQNCQGQTLPAGGSCSVNYEFTPSAPGTYTDTSSFTVSETDNQADGEDFSVSLTGSVACSSRVCHVIDRCQLNPALCDLQIDPTPGDPPDPGETTPTFEHELTGTAKVKGEGFKTSQRYTLQLSFDTTAATFLAMDADGTVYSGHLAPQGERGNKLRLFLDDASEDSFSSDVAERAATVSGRSAGAVLGESSELTLRLREDGSIALKVKWEVLTSGIGEVVFKANLTGAAPVQ